MTDKPIIFSGKNPLLIRDGRKTQTRREVMSANSLVDGSVSRKLFNDLDPQTAWVDTGPSPAGNPGPYLKANRIHGDTTHRIYSRVQAGDRLWVREAIEWSDGFAHYEADGSLCPFIDTWVWKRPKLPAMYMPFGCWRTMIEITDVRVERVWDITEADCFAEGVVRTKLPFDDPGNDVVYTLGPFTNDSERWRATATQAFARAWVEMHGASSWNGAWVWAYTFKVAEIRA